MTSASKLPGKFIENETNRQEKLLSPERAIATDASLKHGKVKARRDDEDEQILLADNGLEGDVSGGEAAEVLNNPQPAVMHLAAASQATGEPALSDAVSGDGLNSSAETSQSLANGNAESEDDDDDRAAWLILFALLLLGGGLASGGGGGGGDGEDSGNNDASSSRSVVPASEPEPPADTTPPEAPTVTPLLANTATPTITGTATLGAGESLSVTLNGVTYLVGDDLTLVGNTWRLTIPAGAALGDGTYDVTATITDEAGNSSSDATDNELSIDTTPPSTPLMAPTSYDDNVGVIQSAGSTAPRTDDNKPGINISRGLTEMPSLYVDGVKVASSYDPVSGALTPVVALADGLHVFTYTLTDALGNESGQSPGLDIIVDTVAPTLLSSTPTNLSHVYPDQFDDNLTLTFNENVIAGSGVIELYRKDGTLIQSFDVASSAITGWGTATLSLDPSANLTVATEYYIKISASALRDSAGNAYAGIANATTLRFATTNADGSITPIYYDGEVNSYLGVAVSSAGDVNGDGYEDIMVGAFLKDEVYIIYGNAAGAGTSFVDGTIAAQKGFKIKGVADTAFGFSVSSAGDINGDGLDDMIIGAYYETLGAYNPSYLNGGGGAVYVVYGSASATELDLSAGTIAAANGFKITGQPEVLGNVPGRNYYTFPAELGISVSNAGDLNGDGFADILVGAYAQYWGDGAAYVIYGGAAGADIDLTDQSIEADIGYKVPGSGMMYLGRGVSSAGDVNGDGLVDLLVAGDATPNAKVFVIYGNTSGHIPDLASGTIAAADGFLIYTQHFSEPGRSVSGVGDVNGDGLADILIGTRYVGGYVDATGDHRSDAGAAFIIYGNASGTGVDLRGSSGNSPGVSTIAADKGFMITGYGSSLLGGSVSGVGDMNGDGLADFVVGAARTNTNAGAAFVVYGRSGGGGLDLSAGTIAPENGFKISGNAINTAFGFAVSGAGDFNGDGLDDVLIGAYRTKAGSGAYSVILGGTQWITHAIKGTGLLSGTGADETIIGSDSGDTLEGGGGVDRFMAGNGEDTIVLSSGDIANLYSNVSGGVLATVDGGGGIDTLRLTGGASLDLTAISGATGMEQNSRIESIEKIDLLTDSAANTLMITLADVLDMSGMNVFNNATLGVTTLGASVGKHQVMIDAGAEDVVQIDSAGWATSGTVVANGHTYDIYNNSLSAAQLLIDHNATVQFVL